MMFNFDHDPNSRNFVSRPLALNRWYVGAVTSLTALLLGLILFRAPIEGYLAKSRITIFLPQAEASPESITPRNLRARIQRSVPIDDSEQISVRLLDVGPPSSQLIEVAFMAPVRESAVRGLTRVMDAAQQWSTEPADVQRTKATEHESIDRTLMQESLARTTLDSFLLDHFAELAELTRQPLLPLKPAENHADSNGKKETLDPSQLQLLRHQLGAAENRQNGLLKDRTTSHPAVKQIAHEIKQLKDDLERVQQRATLARERKQQVSQASTEIDLTDELIDPAILSAAAAKFNELRQSYVTARQGFENEVHAVIARTENDAGSTSQATCSFVEPVSVRRIGGTPSIGRVSLLAILALGIGAGFVRLAGRLPAGNVLSDAREIEQRFSLPVIGTLSTSSHAPSPADPTGATIIRWSTRGCEFALGIFVFTLLIAATLDSPTSASFAHDPFGAISETVARLTTF